MTQEPPAVNSGETDDDQSARAGDEPTTTLGGAVVAAEPVAHEAGGVSAATTEAALRGQPDGEEQPHVHAMAAETEHAADSATISADGDDGDDGGGDGDDEDEDEETQKDLSATSEATLVAAPPTSRGSSPSDSSDERPAVEAVTADGASSVTSEDSGGDHSLNEVAAQLRAPHPTSAAAASDARTPAVIESQFASPSDHLERSRPGLLEEVAQALDAQAAEYRDRARGRLPGMPATPVEPSESRLPAAGAEFEDPEDGQTTSLTPAVIPVVEDVDDGDRAIAFGEEENTHADAGSSLLFSAAATAGYDGRPTAKMPPAAPLPGAATTGTHGSAAAATATAPVARPGTPATGMPLTTSGRVRLPTPPTGRTLPPGTMSPFATRPSYMDLPAIPSPVTLLGGDSSRSRANGNKSGSTKSGPHSARAASTRNARATHFVLRGAPSSLGAVLTAHVKLATLNLAGLIALTFAGGLFVGMLVWRGQGRAEPGIATRTAPAAPAREATPTATAETVTASAPPVAAAQEGAPALPTPPPPFPAPTPSSSARSEEAAAAVAAGTTAALAMGATHAAPPAPVRKAVTVAKEPVVAPLPASSPAEAAPADGAPGNELAAAAPRPAKPRRVAPPANAAAVAAEPKPTPAPVATASHPSTPVVRTVAAAKPVTALRPASLTVAKQPVATNTPLKPAVPKKPKPVWHDPFAD